MNKSAVLLAGALLWASGQDVVAGPAGSPATPASRVFEIASPSIVVIEALDAQRKPVAFGSGVVIAKDVVVSNCHVFSQAGTVYSSVIYRQKAYAASLRYGDVKDDLCSFTVEGLDAPPVAMGSTATLAVGDKVYAIGAPEGYDLTLSDGLVSSLRKLADGVAIQTTAPISPGSSGGGLFDGQGRLVGITSYQVTAGQQLNFALPVEWVEALPRHGKTVAQLRQAAAPNPVPDSNAPKSASSATPRKETFSEVETLAKKGDAEAQAHLGDMYWIGDGITLEPAKAAYWYERAAEQGNARAQANLGTMYDLGQGVPQDRTKAFYWRTKAAEQGDTTGQYNLGAMYATGQGIPRDLAKAFYWYTKAAEQGGVIAQYALGVMYDNGEGIPQDFAKAAHWYAKAAEQGYADAQNNLGIMCFQGHGVPQSYVEGAKWLILAKAKGTDNADKNLEHAEQTMTSAQISEAQRLAAEWWAAHPPAGAPPSASTTASALPTVTVTSVVLGRAVGPDQMVTEPTMVFRPTDTIHASVATVGSSTGATLSAKWTYQTGQSVNESSETIAPRGNATTSFHISKPDGWPEGNYTVEIFLDGRPVATKAFSVR